MTGINTLYLLNITEMFSILYINEDCATWMFTVYINLISNNTQTAIKYSMKVWKGEVKERAKVLILRRSRRSQVKMEEMSFQVSLENGQGLSFPNRGGKFIPPARNDEWKCSGKWFCAALWWHHEASLTRRSQASGGDVDCHQWVEVGGRWACECSICKHQCLELDASCNWEPVQGDKESCDMGPFGFAEDQSCCSILNHLLRFDCA